MIRHQEEEIIQRMLNDLGELDRAAIILRYWQGFSEEEIAAALSISVSAVKSRLHRSRQNLARVFSQNGSP